MPGIFTKLRWNAFVLWHGRRERSFPFLPLEKVQAIQSRRVRAMVEHAYRNVPFYREAMDQRGLNPRDFRTADDLARLPLIDRDLYVQQPEKFVAPNFAQADGLTLHSSGTTGTPKDIRQEARALFLAFVSGHRRRVVFSHFIGRSFGYRETRFARPLGMPNIVRRFYEERSWTPRRIDLKRQKLSPGDLSVEDTAAALNEFGPDHVVGYGSYLGALFREIHQRKIPIHRPKLITYSADSMPDADRLLIEREFGIPVVSTYQCTEIQRMAFYCEQRTGFHLSLDLVAARVVDDENREVAPGESGHIIVSNLTNRATVLLNYKLGDIVTRAKLPCPCGRTLPMIENIRGRSGDVLRLADGRVMHALVATEPLLAVREVRQVQVVQQARDRFVLRAVAMPGANKPQVSSTLASALRSKVGSTASVEVEWLEAIAPGPNGKVKPVISELDREPQEAS
jgi:phenylacetate-CoA ligase